MAIDFDEEQGTYTLLTENSMYQMKQDRYGVLLHTWFGPVTEPYDYAYRITYANRGFSGNPAEALADQTYSLDALPQEYPSFGSGDYRSCALKVRCPDGTTACELRVTGHEIRPGKYALPGLPALYADETEADTLIIHMEDTRHLFAVDLYYGVLENADIITRAVRVENLGEAPIWLEDVRSLCLDDLNGTFDLHTFYGRHEKERTHQRETLCHGIKSIGSVRGTSSHQYNPFLILSDPDATEDTGGCRGFSLLYSGDFLGQAELDQYDQTRLLLGIHPDNFCYRLDPGECFYAPEAAMAYTGKGLGSLSRIFHRAYRTHLCRGPWMKKRRPVLLNSWESVQFDFNGEKLLAMAKEAANLGIELFVLDDGWFGQRNRDDIGLGDWVVNEEKLGCSLREFSDQIHDLGLLFGLWFEPEGVNEDSDLYRAHPDWVLKIPGKEPCRSRHQLLLDFSRADVRNYLLEEICRVLDEGRVDYVKWDMNRSLSDLYSAALPADRQGEVAYRYVLGVYDVLENLIRRYPDLLIESCSGGGGRFDAGMLYYTPQIWCSDDTDAIERLSIQYGTSFGYPISAVGAHVSGTPNEQTGRRVPLATRATVAMAGTFGYELDLTRLTPEEKEEIRGQIRDYKNDYELIQNGEYYRLTDPDSAGQYHAWEFASSSGDRALVCVVSLRANPNGPASVLRLRGLNPAGQYEVKGPYAADRSTEADGDGQIFPGDVLMQGGLPLPFFAREYDSFRILIRQTEKSSLTD